MRQITDISEIFGWPSQERRRVDSEESPRLRSSSSLHRTNNRRYEEFHIFIYQRMDRKCFDVMCLIVKEPTFVDKAGRDIAGWIRTRDGTLQGMESITDVRLIDLSSVIIPFPFQKKPVAGKFSKPTRGMCHSYHFCEICRLIRLYECRSLLHLLSVSYSLLLSWCSLRVWMQLWKLCSEKTSHRSNEHSGLQNGLSSIILTLNVYLFTHTRPICILLQNNDYRKTFDCPCNCNNVVAAAAQCCVS